MPIGSPNEEKYKQVQSKVGTKPITTLCQEAGVSYQSYNNWAKKQIKAPVAAPHKLRIQVQVSIRELANIILSGSRTMPLEIETVVRGMGPDERKNLSEELGARRLEKLINSQEEEEERTL